jgi:hypothetical protein
MSRTAHLKARKSILEQRVKDLELIVDTLQSSSDHDATTLLAQLRLGETVENLSAGIRSSRYVTASHNDSKRADICGIASLLNIL